MSGIVWDGFFHIYCSCVVATHVYDYVGLKCVGVLGSGAGERSEMCKLFIAVTLAILEHDRDKHNNSRINSRINRNTHSDGDSNSYITSHSHSNNHRYSQISTDTAIAIATDTSTATAADTATATVAVTETTASPVAAG